jgi:hypothetical protein
MVLVRILMSNSGFEDEVLIKLIVNTIAARDCRHLRCAKSRQQSQCCCWGCKACHMLPLMSLDLLTIEAAIDFCRQQLYIRRMIYWYFPFFPRNILILRRKRYGKHI